MGQVITDSHPEYGMLPVGLRVSFSERTNDRWNQKNWRSDSSLPWRTTVALSPQSSSPSWSCYQANNLAQVWREDRGECQEFKFLWYPNDSFLGPSSHAQWQALNLWYHACFPSLHHDLGNNGGRCWKAVEVHTSIRMQVVPKFILLSECQMCIVWLGSDSPCYMVLRKRQPFMGSANNFCSSICLPKCFFCIIVLSSPFHSGRCGSQI